ncbi:MAG: L,D-transpeptidase family protein [Candidatus Omnitrophica bacterium]|nr:L,D-transpeptidase family protein [Candidatus Omnitrophota bacterium]
MKNKLIVAGLIIFFIVGIFALASVIKKIRVCPVQNSASGVSFSALMSQAKEFESKNNLLEAKNSYQKLVNEFPSSGDVMNWQKKVEELNIKLLFSPAITPKSISYVIKPGDTLAKIAREFNTTTDLIIKSNNLPGDRISPGKKIKVWNAPFTIFVDKSQNSLILKTKDEEIIKTYTVSTGANNSTPVGTFKIVEKIANPPWFKPGATQPIPAGNPENILGTRWLGLSIPSYGIHGTVDPQSLGRQVTQGCVRMANPEVEELYIIVPKGTEVTIVD